MAQSTLVVPKVGETVGEKFDGGAKMLIKWHNARLILGHRGKKGKSG